MERRNFINQVGLSAAVVATLGSSPAFASATSSKHQRKKLKPSGIAQAKLDAVIEAAEDCLEAGEICNAHCIAELAQGNKSVAECLLAVQNTLAVCRSLLTIAAVDSLDKGTLVRYAKACHDICQNCANECEKHIKHHVECKECYDACQDCMKACLALA